MLLIHQALRRDFPPGPAVLATLLLAGGTSLFPTIVVFDQVASAVMFAAVAALVYMERWFRAPAVRYGGWLAALLLPMVVRFLGADPRASSLFLPPDGFLSLYPVTYLAFIGTVGYGRREAYWPLATLAAVTLWTLIAADLTPALALVAPGLAWLLEAARRRPLLAVAPLVLFAVAWNYWMMVQYTTGTLPKDAPVSFAALVRQQADVHTRAPYVYPFAFPANVLFAWREGVPVAQYDVLAAEPRRASFAIVFDRSADRFLLDGWGPPGANDAGAFRWIDAPHASIVFPLDPPSAEMHVALLVTARGDRATQSELTVASNGQVIGGVRVDPTAPVDARLTIPAGRVGQLLRAGYNRLSIVTSGPHRIAIHRLQVSPAP